MPERPDLEYVVSRLSEELVGRALESMLLRKPVVLRVALPCDDPADLCRGQRIAGVARQGHFVRLALEGDASRPDSSMAGEIVLSPMLAGVFDIVDGKRKLTADTAVAWDLDDGRQLRYRDRKQMGKVYLIAAGDEDKVAGLAAAGLGLDTLDPKVFTLEAFVARARERRDQVRVFLMDKSALDSMGNAYADEVLWRARLHPKAWVRKLTEEQLEELHAAIGEVLGEATETIARRAPPLPDKLRDFLKVRGRAGEPCPRCETKLRKAGVRGYDAHFCPTCQPDARGSGIVDWRKTRR